MQIPEKYKLTLDTYSDQLRDIFQELVKSNDFNDVTLVCEDKKQIKAHRNILSACSLVFKNFLQIDPHSNHSVIYLKGIQYSEMKAIIQFIYEGEAILYQERMDEFLSAARSLEIKELVRFVQIGETDDNMDKYSENSDTENNRNLLRKGKLGLQKRKYTKRKKPLEALNFEGTEVKTENEDLECGQCGKKYRYKASLEVHIQSEHKGIRYDCSKCGKIFKEQSSLVDHSRAIHEGYKLKCDLCDFQTGRKQSLRYHKLKIHEGVTYDCDECNRQFSTQQHLNRHIEHRHFKHENQYNVKPGGVYNVKQKVQEESVIPVTNDTDKTTSPHEPDTQDEVGSDPLMELEDSLQAVEVDLKEVS